MADIQSERNDYRSELAVVRAELTAIDGHYRERIRVIEAEADRVNLDARRRIAALEIEVATLRRRLAAAGVEA